MCKGMIHMKSNCRITPEDVALAVGTTPQAIRVQMQKGLINIGQVSKTASGRYNYDIQADKVYRQFGICLKGFTPSEVQGVDVDELADKIVKGLINALVVQYAKEVL